MKVPLGNELVEGRDVSYNTLREEWNEYLVEDGTTIRLRLIVKRIVRTDKDDPNGKPIYVVESTNVLDVRTPED